MLLKREEGKKEPAATASVRVIPVIPVLLWQQARALVKKKKKRKRKGEIMYISKNTPENTDRTNQITLYFE